MYGQVLRDFPSFLDLDEMTEFYTLILFMFAAIFMIVPAVYSFIRMDVKKWKDDIAQVRENSQSVQDKPQRAEQISFLNI